MKKLLFFAIYAIFLNGELNAQSFSRADSLRGTLNPLRSCFDVYYYDLRLSFDPENKFISGSNEIYFIPTRNTHRIQLDLFKNLKIHSVKQNGVNLKFEREGNAFYVDFPKTQIMGKHYSVIVEYEGKPTEAKNPPWDGGFVWRKDAIGNDWATVACEGIGASSWWPNKDHLSDEPDSMQISCHIPGGLMCVSNGNLRSAVDMGEAGADYVWFVSYPINSYNVTVNIGDYVHLKEQYVATDKAKLDLDYYVLRPNVEKARTHFAQIKPMLRVYEKYFGKYPFGKDGYGIVETPYWGMEHQGAIAYGNNYRNNEYDFDFIIIHESGHEYFGNSLSCNDAAEMWIHEAFTTYMESLYVEELQGTERSLNYLKKQRAFIKNTEPMIGPMGVNYKQKDNDIYYKGTWMLHTLRNIVNNDQLWFAALKNLAIGFRNSNVTTEQIVSYLSFKTKMDLSPFFNLYLKSTVIPKLEYSISDSKQGTVFKYRWAGQSKIDFAFPIKVGYNPVNYVTVTPKAEWQQKVFPKLSSATLKVATDLYLIDVKKQ